MKARSVKLRTLISLWVIWKYGDENHRVNLNHINEHLKPYRLDGSYYIMTSIIEAMRDFGIDVPMAGSRETRGFWIKKRPLSGDGLKKLVYAVTSNPYISETEADAILEELKPFVTVYQEPWLKTQIRKRDKIHKKTTMFKNYATICEAIINNRRISFIRPYVVFEHETQTVDIKNTLPVLFIPKYMYQANETIYAVGYHCSNNRVELLDLSTIEDVQISSPRVYPHMDKINKEVAETNPEEYIKKPKQVIYKGEVIFKCRAQYLTDIYHIFGLPNGPAKAGWNRFLTCTIENTELTTENLYQLRKVGEKNVHIIGPPSATNAIKFDCEHFAKRLTSLCMDEKKRRKKS